MKLTTLLLALSAATLLNCGSTCTAQTLLPDAFTYQGRLNSAGSPLTGTADVQFSLWDSIEAGTQVGLTFTQTEVAVSNGVFTASPDFGAAAFQGQARWIQIAVRSPAGSGAYTTLTPRQALTAAPYALYAKNNWAMGGNAATNSATNFVGTSDNQPLNFKVNNSRAMQYQYAVSIPGQYQSINVLGGSEINIINAGVRGATISGGGLDSFEIDGFDYPNRVSGDFGTVAGGSSNTAAGSHASVSGGFANTSSGVSAAVGGGYNSTASGEAAAVAGGYLNVASGFAATVGGGYFNAASANCATVGGGFGNTAAGTSSFAAGRRANAIHNGSFVWADGNLNNTFSSSAPNQFCIRAFGGIVLETDQDGFLYTSSTVGEKNRYFSLYNSPQTPSASGLKAGGILCADSFNYAQPGKNDLVVKGQLGVGYPSNPSGFKLAVNGGTYSLAGYFGSDARYKTNIAPLESPLGSILALRGVSFDWNRAKFPDQNFSAEHQMGFIAQEVESVFPQLVTAGPDGYKAVNYTAIIPVVVEAVKAQQKQLDQLKADIAKRDEMNADLKAALAELRARLGKLEQQPSNTP